MITKRLIPWYGYRRDSIDQRDYTFKSIRAAPLPTIVDLRNKCPPVMDQGELGSCTAHGITGIIRFAMMQNGIKDVPLARLQLYYDERVIEGTVASDAGAEIRDGIKTAAKLGVAHEKLWPYNIRRFKTKPTASVYQDAIKFRLLEYKRVGGASGTAKANDVKLALATWFPVVFGFNVFAQFESDQCAKDGIVHMPASNEQPIGGHCVYLVGYGQKPGYFTARNSWAADWGDKGDFYLPDRYIETQASDFWIITNVGA